MAQTTMSTTIDDCSHDRRFCEEGLTTADGITVWGSMGGGWYIIGPQRVLVGPEPDRGGPTNALIWYRGQCMDAERAKEGNELI